MQVLYRGGKRYNKTSQYRGVSYNSRSRRWRAQYYDRGEHRQVYVGEYHTELEAAQAYDSAVIGKIGGVGRLNRPQDFCAIVPPDTFQCPKCGQVCIGRQTAIDHCGPKSSPDEKG